MKSHCSRLSCFFCLRSNSNTSKHLNPGFDDSPGFCESVEQTASSFHEFSLRNLYRFLNLLHSDKEEKDFSDLKMPICEECFRLNEEFNKLYNLLEETKLRLNWRIQKLQVVMTKARIESRISFQEDQIEEDLDEEKILEIWRSHTLDRMKAVSSASFPRIVLHKNKPKRPSFSESEWMEEKFIHTLPEDKTTDRGNMNIQPQPSLLVSERHFQEEDEKKFCHEDAIHPNHVLTGNDNDALEIKMECDLKVEETLIETQERCLRLKEKRKRRCPAFIMSQRSIRSTKCHYCSFVCGAHIRRWKRSMMKHQVRFHPEHFLFDKSEMNQHQASGFKPERFRQILTDVVFPKFVRRNGRYASCSTCGIRYTSINTSQNIASVRQHLLLHHKTELKKKLKAGILNSESEIKRKKSTKSSAGVDSQSQCTYCCFKISSAPGTGSLSASMVHHLMRFHPQHYLNNEDDKALWKEKFRDILEKIVYPKFILSGSCSLCGKTYQSISVNGNAISMQKHISFCHKKDVKEAFKMALEDPSLEQKLRSCSATKEKTPEPHKKYSSKNCPYCRFKCSSSLMEAHLIRFHPQHYLIDENDKESGLWHKEFPKILTNLIYPNFILKEAQRRSCTSCGKMFQYKYASQNTIRLKRHLIFSHKTELKEKFKVVLQDPLFEDRLKRCKAKEGKAPGGRSNPNTENRKVCSSSIRTSARVRSGCAKKNANNEFLFY